MIHKPVLVHEVIEYLKPKPGMIIVDGTLNGGGHSKAMLEHTQGKVTIIGIEIDRHIAAHIKKEHIKGLTVENENYKNMKSVLHKHNIEKVDGVLFDFGLSSWHLDESGRGFTFRGEEPLDMRFTSEEETTAASLVNSLTESQLADLFFEYGDEPRARKVAKAIVSTRKHERIITTAQLVSIINACIQTRSKIHPATRIFQALRIAVNNELNNVRAGIQTAMDSVKPHGRVVAISFHSLEDRIVKSAFRSRGTELTKKGLSAGVAEIKNNPRARSARLRAWENA